MSDLSQILFVAEEFKLQTPAQQLLDRLLAGYARDGMFRRPEKRQVTIHLASPESGANSDLERREKDFGLLRASRLSEAMRASDAVVVVWRGSGAQANESLLKSVIESAREGTNIFVHGVLGNSLNSARQMNQLAAARQAKLIAGTPLPVTWRLPEVRIPKGTQMKAGLAVVQGIAPAAEFHGLEVLLPIIERRQGGESGIASIRFLNGDKLWQAAAEEQVWAPLLAAAISRSNHPQGDPVTDGRTQDLFGLGLLPKLARDAWGWILEHRDGFRSALLVLNGAIADYTFAVRTNEGGITSAQVYRPPSPHDHQFSALAAVVEDFLRNGEAPWPVERNALIAGLLGEFAQASARTGEPTRTESLAISFGG